MSNIYIILGICLLVYVVLLFGMKKNQRKRKQRKFRPRED